MITGAASGIGRAIAERFVGEGARVVLGDCNEALLNDVVVALPPDAVVSCCVDVAVEGDVERLHGRAATHFGRLDVGVNCAGVSTFSPLADHAVEEWDRVLAVDLRGVFLGVKHQARAFLAAESGGVIINIASINAYQPAEGMAAYCCAKAGVEMLTRCAALELGRFGVRVCGIAPGLVDTPLTAFGAGIRAEFLSRIPLGREGRPEEIAGVAAWLAGDEATWVSGHTMVVDGAELTREYPRLFDLVAGPDIGP